MRSGKPKTLEFVLKRDSTRCWIALTIIVIISNIKVISLIKRGCTYKQGKSVIMSQMIRSTSGLVSHSGSTEARPSMWKISPSSLRCGFIPLDVLAKNVLTVVR